MNYNYQTFATCTLVACLLFYIAHGAGGFLGSAFEGIGKALGTVRGDISHLFKPNPLFESISKTDYESSVSLTEPFDMNLNSWKMVGNVVLTSSFARLTPSVAGQQGILLSNRALESNDWQISMEMSIFNKNENGKYEELGGDGLAVWFLHKSNVNIGDTDDSSDSSDSSLNSIKGNLFGIRNDFNGFGIIFDTYDNNDNRDNPLIFVLKQNNTDNGNKESSQWDHGNDFEKSMYGDTKLNPFIKEAIFSNKCTLNYHNKERVRVTMRYQNGLLHVYTDLEYHHSQGNPTGKWEKIGFNRPIFNLMNNLESFVPGLGSNNNDNNPDSLHVTPHLCLRIPINIETKDDFHIALSAMTGSVSDNHDIYKFETKYLSKGDSDIDDSQFDIEKYKSKRGGWIAWTFWFWIVSMSVCLIAETIAELNLLDKYEKNKMHVVYAVNEINKSMQVSYLLHFAQFILLIFSFNVKCLLVNLPLIIIRAQKYMTDTVLLQSYNVNRKVFWFKTTFKQWLFCRMTFLIFALLYHIWRLLHV